MFTLDQVVPWGRSFDEYARMFGLTDTDLRGRILSCADGPASFNAEATARGIRVVSCDPLYQCQAEQIRQRIDVTSKDVLEQTRRNAHEFVWDTIRSVDELGRLRLGAMEQFLADYESGKLEHRYVQGELPTLPFSNDSSFDLAVCSHFLFLYTNHLTEDFHVASIREMCRIAPEARIFPLLALGGQRSQHLAPTTERLNALGYSCSIERVDYEFQRGGNEMLRVTRRLRKDGC